jgi:two-component system chemotaxis response regulator CheY
MTKTVLAIDDSLTVRELVSFVLTNAGYVVVLAQDGIEGLEQLSRCAPDVVITDINMPRLDGFGFIERARSETKCAAPILVLTTEGDAEKKARARNAGATGWIVKPFNPTQLIEAVRRVSP